MKKTINLVTAIIDFCMAVILMMIAVSGRSVLAFVFAVIFVGMGVYFLRYFERQRRLDNMTEEERAQFFANGGAILMPHEVERLNREKEEKEGFVKKSEHRQETPFGWKGVVLSGPLAKKFGKLP